MNIELIPEDDRWSIFQKYAVDRLRKYPSLPRGWRFLTPLDILQPGDRYDLGGGNWAVIGGSKTSIRAGQIVPMQILCYTPCGSARRLYGTLYGEPLEHGIKRPRFKFLATCLLRCLVGEIFSGLKFGREIRSLSKTVNKMHLQNPKSIPAALEPGEVASAIVAEIEQIKEMLLAKNADYGNSALDPVRIFSKADPLEQIRVRMDDKLSRIARGSAGDEDPKLDLIGYLVLERVGQRLGFNLVGKEKIS